MTKHTALPGRESLVVAKKLWHAGGFLEPGTEWADHDTEQAPVDEKLVRHYLDTGFLQDRDVLERARNAEAFEARQAAADKDAKISELEQQLETFKAQSPTAPDLTPVQALLPGVTTVADIVKQVKALQAKASAEPAAPDLSAVTALLPGVTTLADLPAAVQGLQGQLKTLQAVHATTGGTEVPANFLRRGRLAPLGLTTYESLHGKTAAQLNAIEGITLEDAEKIVGLVDTHFAAAPTG